MRAAALAAAVAIAACTPVEMRTPAAQGVCNAASLGELVGKRASDARAEAMLKRSNARDMRWIAPDAALTMDFRPDRLNAYVDGKGRIARFTCG